MNATLKKTLTATLGTRFNQYWVALWAINCVILVSMLYAGVSPMAWFTAFVVLFLLPEMIGLRRRGDSLPPLTYTIRRYVPRWVPSAVTWGVAAWMAWVWCLGPEASAEHPLLVFIAIIGTAGWLTNHWDVTYDGLGE